MKRTNIKESGGHMKSLTDHDLLIRLDEKFDIFVLMMKVDKDEAKEWRNAHEASDSLKFKSAFEKLDNLRNYAVSVAMVAGFCGGILGFGLAIIKSII